MDVVREVATGKVAGWNARQDLLSVSQAPSDFTGHGPVAELTGAIGGREVFSLLGRIASRLRMRRFALRLARAAASRAKHPEHHWELATRLLGLETEGLPIEANKHLRNELLSSLGIAAQSNIASIRAAATTVLAETLYRTGRYPEALALTEKTTTATVAEPRQLRVAANSLVASGRFREGRAIYSRMMTLDAANGELKRKIEILAPFVGDLPRPQVRDSEASILIGVGGGIGDMLHATPAMRNIARRNGERVDVLVLADHAGAECLGRNSEYVNRVWTPDPEVLSRRYRTVFLTHSFGPMRFPFNAGRTIASSDWRTFRPGLLNETLFNLEAAKQLLGFEWDDSDVAGYFAGDFSYRRPAEILAGFHAGSKGGRWLSKRWPHFHDVASRLISRGIRVASFGTPDEYVEGTENRTGGTLAEMCRAMLDCTHFISNDSGPMHIANALGIPVLALFAPTDVLTHLPLRPSTVALSLAKRCSPCEVKDHKYFASGRCRCVAEISASEVEQKLMTMIQDTIAERPLMPQGPRPPALARDIIT